MTDLERIESRLSNLEDLLNQHHESGGWLDLRRASSYTGLSQATLRRAVKSGKLKCSKQTGKLIFHRSWLDKYLLFGKQRLTATERAELTGF